ncbi:hypothetical protein M378DRAFT_287632 [Amanita muscaria Koide BX008]|uniref:Uncharacterized protein n=1 Tax=Amanita muscaria (strain Koide BX008) TaxID=946122 RepID=A0A0C2WRK1_AMAMK|nr:hypothetical protein M378DRAFT_287632 [Amanita muscaria Koide BX008]
MDIHEEPLIDTEETVETPESKWTIKKRSLFKFSSQAVRKFVTDNTGLLLVLLSQVFISMMNAAVKQLSTIDPPVSALQMILVRTASHMVAR